MDYFFDGGPYVRYYVDTVPVANDDVAVAVDCEGVDVVASKAVHLVDYRNDFQLGREDEDAVGSGEIEGAVGSVYYGLDIDALKFLTGHRAG